MTEDCLLTGALEPTNEAYAIAKIAGLKLCQYYRKQYGVDFHSAMPTNLYGPGDNYHPKNSHVLPALIRRFHEAREAGRPEVAAWGTGHAAAGIPARGRPGRRLRLPPRADDSAGLDQRRDRDGRDDPGADRDRGRGDRVHGAGSPGTPPSPTARRASSSTSRSSRRWAGRPGSRSGRASRRPTPSFLAEKRRAPFAPSRARPMADEIPTVPAEARGPGPEEVLLGPPCGPAVGAHPLGDRDRRSRSSSAS